MSECAFLAIEATDHYAVRALSDKVRLNTMCVCVVVISCRGGLQQKNTVLIDRGQSPRTSLPYFSATAYVHM